MPQVDFGFIAGAQVAHHLRDHIKTLEILRGLVLDFRQGQKAARQIRTVLEQELPLCTNEK
jgi:hypothetical protein